MRSLETAQNEMTGASTGSEKAVDRGELLPVRVQPVRVHGPVLFVLNGPHRHIISPFWVASRTPKSEKRRCRRKACRRKAEMSRRKAEMVRDVAEKAEMSPKKAETPKSAKRRGCRRKAEKAFMCRRKAKLEDRHTNKPKLGLSTTQAWFTRTNDSIRNASALPRHPK